MSGHSKWANIKHRKEAQDNKKGKIFTKIARELTVAAKIGGGDPASNSRLRLALDKARSANMPKDNVEREIKKGTGEGNDQVFEDITYEGYAPGGVGILVKTLTDNRNRTAGNLRHYFSKYGGNLGSTGCVSFMFTQKGVIVIDLEETDFSKLEEEAIESGAVDFIKDDDCFIIYTEKEDYENIYNYFKDNKYKIISSEIGMVPETYVNLSDEESEKVNILLDVLDEDEDITNVWHNLK